MASPKQTVFPGDVFPTQNYGNVTVLKYEGTNQVTIMFGDGTKRVTSVTAIKGGSVKNLFQPCIYGVGFLGCESKDYCAGNIKETPEYSTWSGMLRRCYDLAHQEKHPAYKGCTVSKEWHNFHNFAVWYKSQTGYSEGWQIDKDLKTSGNKVYSADACTLVPREVNNLLEDRKNGRGRYPIGVHYNKANDNFIAQRSEGSGTKYLGSFSTPEEAFAMYKRHKESRVQFVASKYKDVLPEVVYNNLMNFTVSITD